MIRKKINEIFGNYFYKKDIINPSENAEYIIRNDASDYENKREEPKITNMEIDTSLKKCKIRKCPGLDLITTKMIKNIHEVTPTFLINLFNTCLKFKYFPK